VDKVINLKLDFGDYACMFNDSSISSTVFERKSLGDLFGTMGKGYKRFKKEIERCKETECKMVLIIEGSITTVLKGTKYSKLKGHSVLMKLFTLWHRYNVLPVFCKDRAEVVRFMIETWNAEGRDKIKEKKC
jgi:ERCC4-type nuclease